MIIIGVTSWSETGSSSKDVKEISRDRLQDGVSNRFSLVCKSSSKANHSFRWKHHYETVSKSRRVSHDLIQSNLVAVHDDIPE